MIRQFPMRIRPIRSQQLLSLPRRMLQARMPRSRKPKNRRRTGSIPPPAIGSFGFRAILARPACTSTKMPMGRKTRTVYYTKFEFVDGARIGKAFATNLDTHETREIGKLPAGRGGSGLAVNADETLLGGSFVDLPPGPGAGGAPGQDGGKNGG